jgi:hypothetical protein
MIDDRPLAPGTRVRLIDPSHALDAPVLTGYIVRPDEWDDYYIVHLDMPARYQDGLGHSKLLTEIREDRDNLEVLEPPVEQEH